MSLNYNPSLHGEQKEEISGEGTIGEDERLTVVSRQPILQASWQAQSC
jgi:hypothetical protein